MQMNAYLKKKRGIWNFCQCKIAIEAYGYTFGENWKQISWIKNVSFENDINVKSLTT